MQKEEFYRILEEPAAMNEESAAWLKTVTESYPWFSLGWLLYCKNLKQIDSPDFDTVLKKTAIRVLNRKLLHDFLNDEGIFEKGKVATFPAFVLDDISGDFSGKDSLIDKFLSSNPGKIRQKSDTGTSAENAAAKQVIEKSTAESDDLITETLANIYFKQKNYQKAIHAYQKLSLKYPEKSVYFAGRIKEIEEITNNNQ